MKKFTHIAMLVFPLKKEAPMKNSLFAIIGAAILLSSPSAFCYLNYYSYQKNPVDSTDTSLTEVPIGSVQLENSEIIITPKGSYLDVVEDAWLSGNISLTGNNDLVNLQFFTGTVSLPTRSVIVGVMIWNNNTALQANLYPAVYSNKKTYPDSQSIASGNKSNLCSVMQLTATDYQVKITNVKVGEAKHVRIRYLMPNSGSATSRYQVPVVFDEQYSSGYYYDPYNYGYYQTISFNPSKIKLTINASAQNKFILTGNQLSMKVSDTSINMVPYQTPFVLTADSAGASVIQLTTFANGSWQGNYFLLNTLVPDTVIGGLSQSVETIFLWRWNAPKTFTETYNGIKNLSAYGQSAVSQAQSISQVCGLLTARGQKAGLVHSIESKPSTVFSLSSKNDASYTQLQAYLARFDANYFLTGQFSNDFTKPSWAPREAVTSGGKDSSKLELLHSLTLSVGLYSSKSGVLHHLVIISSGPIANVQATVTKAEIDSLLKNVTCDASSAQWQDVNFSQVVSSAQQQNLQSYAGYFFPVFQPDHVSLGIASGSEKFTFLLAPTPNDTLALTAKSLNPWDTVFTWTGYSAAGQKTGSMATVPVINKVVSDSGIVKIWAGDPNRLSDNVEENLGGVYGILTKGFWLQAGARDSVSNAGKTVPYLADSQITMPAEIVSDKLSVKKLPAQFSYHVSDGFLFLELPVNGSNCILTIVDMMGRCILKTNLTAFGTTGMYRIPLSRFANNRFSQMYCAKIQGEGFQKNFILFKGDRL